MRPPQRIFYHCDFWDFWEFFMLQNPGLKKFSLRLPVLVNFSTATFILFYALLIHSLLFFIMHHLLHLLQRLLYMSTFVCPGTLLFFFNFFNLNQNYSYSILNSGAVSYGSNCSSAVIFNIYSIATRIMRLIQT
jgi:hypothetical protein